MNTVPERSRVRLPDISSRAYEHPADRSALVALRKLTGFDAILRNIAGLFSDRSLRLLFLASSVRASEQQFPQLYQMLLDGAYVLDLPRVPELFITQDPTVNAMALGTDKPFIVITSGLVDLMDEDEIRFVIGHELGHVLSGHSVYRTMLFALISLAARFAVVPIAWIGLKAVIWGLEEWYRKSELSCDRAGLLACQDVPAARRALMKTAGGSTPGRAERRRVPRAGARVRRGAGRAREPDQADADAGRRPTRSPWCGSPSLTAGPTRASTATSWPAITRAAMTTGTPRSATSSRRRARRIRTTGAGPPIR